MSSGLYNTHKIDFDTTLDLTRLKPYGDTMNDGKVQTSFTLPIKDDERGEEAARQIAKKMGLEEPNVAYHTPLVHLLRGLRQLRPLRQLRGYPRYHRGIRCHEHGGHQRLHP